MINKTWRLLKALGRETVKRVPYIIAILLVIGSVGAVQSYLRTRDNSKTAKDNTIDIKGIVEQLDLKNPDSALSKFLAANRQDNAEQTLILCKVIIGSNLGLRPNDITTVEDICKEKIRQAQNEQSDTTFQAGPAKPTGAQSTNSTQSSVTSPSSQPAPLGGVSGMIRKSLDFIHNETNGIPLLRSIL